MMMEEKENELGKECKAGAETEGEKSMTECECYVMKCVWDTEDDMSLLDITQMVNERYHKEWKPQTVSTFLSRLVTKEYLEMYRKGRKFFYHPHVEIEQYKSQMVAECVSFWCGDDMGEALRVFCRTRSLCGEEIEKIRQVIAAQ